MVSDQLFMTLDPLVRKVRLGPGREMLLVDTVGFIQKLPHALVAAFRATLEEVTEADLLLHVVDASAAGVEEREAAVESVLREIGAGDRPRLLVLNKADRTPRGAAGARSPRRARAAPSSPRSPGTGLDGLLAAVASRLDLEPRRVQLSFAARPTGGGWPGCTRAGRVLGHEVAGRAGRPRRRAVRPGDRALPGAPSVRRRRGPAAASWSPPAASGVLGLPGCAKRVAPPVPEGEDYLFAAGAPGEVSAGEAKELRYAWSEVLAGDTASAARRYEKLLQRRPGLAAARTGLAFARLRAGRLEEAAAGFAAVLADRPDDLAALVGAGLRRRPPGRHRRAPWASTVAPRRRRRTTPSCASASRRSGCR